MKRTGAILVLLSFFFLTCCAGGTQDSSDIINDDELGVDVPRDTYRNSFTEEQIPDYWESYGVGDPFVYRFDGMYYLICSTTWMNTSTPGVISATGLLGWKSKDLIHWEKCTGKGLPEGYISVDDCTYIAYAPEMTYINGKFYIVESRHGEGHYILESDSPEGPFVKSVDNFGLRIDGSFFVDDDESIYLLNANTYNISCNKLNYDMASNSFKITSNGDLDIDSNVNFEGTSIASWTEGPYMLKKDGIYYLTYTGPAVSADSYKVGYSYYIQDDNSSFFSEYSFNSTDDYILLNTDDDYRGLGHSATVLGPNMDSYYIAYHSLVSVNGPYRRYNIARLNFNGSEMSVNHPELENNLSPQMPDFSSYNKEGMQNDLSNKGTDETFTVEFNAKGNNKMYFSYIDESNYAYVQMQTGSSDTLVIGRVENGNDTIIQSIKMNNKYDYSKLHTFRVAHRDGKLRVYFDNMMKIDTVLNKPLSGGKVGYESGSAYSFTGFSNDAFDSSAQKDYKQDKFLSSTYDEEKSVLDDESIVTLERTAKSDGSYNNGLIGQKAVKLHSKGQRASYKIYNFEDGYYGLDLTISNRSQGKRIGVRIDNGPIETVTIPNEGFEEDAIKYYVTSFSMAKGTHYITLYYEGDEVEIINGSYYKTTDVEASFENDLSSYMTQGATYVNMWKVKDGAHYAMSENRQLIYIGQDTLRNYVAEVDIKFDGNTVANVAGIVARADNPSFHATYDTRTSIQGYYCSLNNSTISIQEVNYNKSKEMVADAGANLFESGRYYRLKVEMIGKTCKFYVDDELRLTYSSALGPTHGKIGLYTTGAACYYKNLSVKTA